MEVDLSDDLAGWYYEREDAEEYPDYTTPHDTFPVGKKSDLIHKNKSDTSIDHNV